MLGWFRARVLAVRDLGCSGLYRVLGLFGLEPLLCHEDVVQRFLAHSAAVESSEHAGAGDCGSSWSVSALGLFNGFGLHAVSVIWRNAVFFHGWPGLPGVRVMDFSFLS